MNAPLVSAGLRPPPPYLTPAPHLPAIHGEVAKLDPGAVIAEFPFGDPWYDVRYMFFAATHGRALVNGYSGVFPRSFILRQRILSQPLARPDLVPSGLDGATHVVVHTAAWPDETGQRFVAWLETRGATLVAAEDGACLLALHAQRP
jgi:hypothetical protein